MQKLKANLLIANSSKETGALLKTYLEERGVIVTPHASVTISYGIRNPKANVLNGNCGRGKIFNMETMIQHGVRTVPFYNGGKIFNIATTIPLTAYPLLARKNHGYGGKDLVPVFQPEELPWRIAAGWQWFSSFIPVQHELRVWVYRDEVLDVYEKVMKRPNEFVGIGRNFGNGFEFVKTVFNFSAPKLESLRAVQALELDFAAVDCLVGKDGQTYILETNTAPGVIRSGAQPTLAKLADKMVEWVKENQ